MFWKELLKFRTGTIEISGRFAAGRLSEGGLLLQARGNSWAQLIFKDMVKFI